MLKPGMGMGRDDKARRFQGLRSRQAFELPSGCHALFAAGGIAALALAEGRHSPFLLKTEPTGEH
jgi:hypothetical protein